MTGLFIKSKLMA